ncbi:hypothetical protein FSP39_017855 [Pinctada imbricata]|uniref:Uncharacterized protein n=1 Tax=Pinctada imbricata TaxID=66713 RepID=A0AA88Y313_PINIB|nr:hypothetical protein FSP39_017855 [Pinctada imbricata]
MNTKIRGQFYPSTLEECFESQGDAPYSIPPEMFCNATWDTVLCWPPTLVGSTTKLPCPKYLNLGTGKYASKSCGINGKWIGIHPGKNIFPKELYPGWTNYSECLGLDYDIKNVNDSADFNVSDKSPVSLGALPLAHNGADVLGSIMLMISLILLVASLVITCCSRTVSTTRTKLYKNFFAAFIIHDTLELVIRLGRSVDSNDVVNDVETCVSIGVMVTLTTSAIYTWLAIIAICFTFTMKGIVIETKIYYILCLLGWFVPTVVTITWLSVTVLEGNLNCWYGELYIAKLESSFWIIESINITLLCSTWVLLIHFLWKFNEHKSHRQFSDNKELCAEMTFIKQSAFKVLVVLCFVTAAYIIYVTSSQDKLSEPIAYALVLTLFSRGITTAIFLCFLEESCKCWDGVYSVENSSEEESIYSTLPT